MKPSFLLTNLTHLRFSGPDAERYLNGQVTQQVSGLADGHSRYTFVCDAKGRILFDATVRAQGSDFLLTVDGGDREEILTRMDRYLIADDCELTDVSEEWVVLHEAVEGADEEGLINRFGYLGRDRYLNSEEQKALESDGSSLSDAAEHEEHRLQQFVPRVPDLRGAFSAETGLEELAVSFHKGCYLGQEVVSRIKRAGKTNRRLVALTLSETSATLPLELSDQAGGKPLLEVTSVARQATAEGFPALGYLRTKYEPGTALLSETGISATLRDADLT